MELQTEKLEEYQLINLKNLSTKKTELIYNIGELYLELSELKKIILGAETDLNQKYPNGEIDLNECSVTFQK
jgi:hypothetical protein